MGVYKFLDSRYMDGVLAGELRFGRLIYYRMREVVEKDEWIGDANHEFLVHGVAPADPFRKHPRYRPQQEWRVILKPRAPYPHADHLDVMIERADRIFRREFRCLPIPKTAPIKRQARSPLDLYREISSAVTACQQTISPRTLYAATMTFAEGVAASEKQSAERDRAFEEQRDPIVQGYWEMRLSFHDPKIDLDVARVASRSFSWSTSNNISHGSRG